MEDKKKNTAAKWIWLSVALLAIILLVIVDQAFSAFRAGLQALEDAANGTTQTFFKLK